MKDEAEQNSLNDLIASGGLPEATPIGEKTREQLIADKDALRAEIAKLRADNAEWLRMAKRKDAIIDAQIKEIDRLKVEIERLKKLDEIGIKAHNANLLEMGDMRAVIHRLKAELAAAVYQNIIQKEMLSDEFVRGLEGALTVIDNLPDGIGSDYSVAIQAEIDKAKAGK